MAIAEPVEAPPTSLLEQQYDCFEWVTACPSPKTVNLEIGTLRAILKRSGHWAYLQPNVKMLTTRDDIGRAITPEEDVALLQACAQSRSRSLVPFVTLALETGARYNVIRTLQWGSVDFENRCLV